MRRKIAFFTVLTLAALLLFSCKNTEQQQEFTLAVASDLHYISPSLTDKSRYYRWRVTENDARVTMYVEELTDAFIENLLKQKPDALLLTGDITFNGAFQSHKDLIQKLMVLKQNNIPVLVLPGNHDVYNPNAASFSGIDFTLLESPGTEEFKTLYEPLCYDNAMSVDPASASYTYRLSDRLILLAIDTNTKDNPCGYSKETCRWIKEQLKSARRNKQKVIAAVHQNLLCHSLFKDGYVVLKRQKLVRLLRSYGVKLDFTGHMHIQHIKKEWGFTEIASSALGVYPLQYGMCSIKGSNLEYSTCKVPVSQWAKENGLTDVNLLDLEAYALKELNNLTIRHSKDDFNIDMSVEEKDKLLDFACKVDSAYFSGDLSSLREFSKDKTFIKIWSDSGTFEGKYYKSILREADKNYTSLKTSF